MTRILTACALLGLVACGDNPSAPTSVGFAPVDMAAFDSLVLGKFMIVTDPEDDGVIEFLSAGRARVEFDDATYEYVNTGLNTGTLTLMVENMRAVDPSQRMEISILILQLTFTTTTSGTVNWSGEGEMGTAPFTITDTITDS